MESLNLHTLANSLPNAQQNAEKELLNNFKAAALSITTLYRSSRKNSKRAYNAGYAAACQDLLTMIQQGVSLNPSAPSHDPEQGGLTIGRVMDWTEARLEAIKAREEEEDEEEEREKEKEGVKTQPVIVAPSKPEFKSSKVAPKTPSSMPTPNSPRSSQPQPPEPSSPSPPPSAALRPLNRPMRSRPAGKGEFMSNSMDLSDASSSADIPIPIVAGAKRRHAMMMMLDSSPPTVSIDGSTTSHSPVMGSMNSVNGGSGSQSHAGRRRTRSSRHAVAQNQILGVNQTQADAMDVEDDGRERKRVTRR